MENNPVMRVILSLREADGTGSDSSYQGRLVDIVMSHRKDEQWKND